MKRFFLLPIVVVLCVCAMASAQKPDQQPQDQAARALIEAYVAAFNAGDVQKIAACWREDGELMDVHGNRIAGRKAIEKRFAEFFASHRDYHLTAHIDAITTPKQGSVLVELTSQLRTHATAEPSQVQSRMHLVETDGRLLIAGAHDALYIPAAAEHLKELQWLVGNWATHSGPSDRASMEGNYSWTSNNSFLIHLFTARRGELAVHGTEVIGWDPHRKAIRSWTFGSHGGFSEGLWKRDGQRWVIHSTGTLPDGSEVSAIETLTRVDDDSLTLQWQDRKRDGKAEPDVAPLTIRRQKVAAQQPRSPLGGLPEAHGSETP